MTSFVYLGVGKNDVAPFVEIDIVRSEDASVDHALALLEEHRSFDRIEIWCEDTRLKVVERSLPEPRP